MVRYAMLGLVCMSIAETVLSMTELWFGGGFCGLERVAFDDGCVPRVSEAEAGGMDACMYYYVPCTMRQLVNLPLLFFPMSCVS